MFIRNLLIWPMLGATALGVAGCASNAGNGALIGGAAGAGLGAIVGHNSHGHTAGGAVVGGLIGAATGAIVGYEIDREQAEQRYSQRYDYDGPYERDVVVQEPDGREVV